MIPGWGAEGATAIWGTAAGARVGGDASSVIRLGIEMRSCDMGPPSSAKILGSFGDVAAPLLPSGGFLVKRREVLQKTRAEQFGLGRVPPTIKSGVGSTEKRSPHADMVSDYLYLRRRVGRTWATSLLQYLVGHQLPIVGGVAHWSAATPALTRRLLPAARGYCSSVDCRACPDTSLVASCRGSGRGLAWHVGSATPPVDGGGQLVGHRAVRRYPEVRLSGGRWVDVAES
ncbi:hypothetical protein GW17_00061630 [Ensete ventricosum]|nr:hypothetical protein GW17_00061630 [Ensete ventricosum]